MTLLGPTTRVAYILVGHLVMSVGFALLFTPLFTVSLSSVRPQLYSHGSAVLGSLQQVAGAAGVAAFVALMSAQSARLAATGVTEIAALSGGIRAAFVLGAVCAIFASLAALFVRKPEAASAHAGH
jgi:DHA2 family lincomycin resistance protein-like MFS transporter